MRKPRIALLATGGTIAGSAAAPDDARRYRAATLAVTELIAALPVLGDIAELRATQVFQLDSRDLTPQHWLALARAVQAQLDDPTIDGVVITHGTDTLEESAGFLDLTLHGRKPVVMTAAMRPATALSADGPLNLYQAVALAGQPAAGRCGVLAVLGDRIVPARQLAKRHPCAVDAFSRPDLPCFPPGEGELARLAAARRGAPLRLPSALHTLPAVELLTVAAGSSPAVVRALLQLPRDGSAAAPDGLVLALPGNASLPDAWRELLLTLPASLPVVLASRCGGGVRPPAPHHPAHWLDAGPFDPLQARVRLIAGLATGLRGARLRRWFERA